MKALLLTNEYPPHVYGGAGVHVEYLARELAKLIDLEVRCFGDQKSNTGRTSVGGIASPAEMLAELPKRERSTMDTLLRSLLFNATPIDADVVHCHTWYTHLGGIVAKLLYGKPLVITTHSLEPLRPWKREQLGRGFDLSSWVERTALEIADAVVAVSKETKADILKHFDVPEGRIEVIVNGIDVEEYHPTEKSDALQRYGVPSDQPYLLFLGRITRQKGIVHLLRAIEHIAADLPVVLCAGQPDTEEIGNEMRERVSRLKETRGNVIWIQEMVDRRTAVQLYAHARLFCCPSVYEPFGIINLEAMACGTPVVASAVGGIPEVVVEGKTGLLVRYKARSDGSGEPDDPDAFARGLAAGIDRLSSDAALNERMAAAGRKHVEERFSWKAIAQQIVSLYRRLARTDAH